MYYITCFIYLLKKSLCPSCSSSLILIQAINFALKSAFCNTYYIADKQPLYAVYFSPHFVTNDGAVYATNFSAIKNTNR